MRVAYPVIFTEMEGNILIEVPDLAILTEANDEKGKKGSMADAIAMARDAIGTKCIAAEDRGEKIVEASDLKDIDISKGVFAEEGTGFVSLVEVDLILCKNSLLINC